MKIRWAAICSRLGRVRGIPPPVVFDDVCHEMIPPGSHHFGEDLICNRHSRDNGVSPPCGLSWQDYQRYRTPCIAKGRKHPKFKLAKYLKKPEEEQDGRGTEAPRVDRSPTG